MSRRAAFRQADLSRAIKAALCAGLAPGTFTVEAEDGKVRILTGAGGAPLPSPDQADTDWDRKLGLQ